MLAQTPANTQEETVVRHLVKRIERRLTDRGGGRHGLDWEPRQNCVVGVLDATRMRQGDDAGSEVGSPKPEVSNPDDVAGIAVDFAVVADPPEIELELTAKFAIYLERYPGYDEQLRYTRRGLVGADAASGEAVAPGDVKRLVLDRVYERVDVSIPPFRMRLKVDGTHTRSDDTVQTEVRAAIDTAFAERGTSRPFTKRTRELRDDELASEEAYWAAIQQYEDHTVTVQYPHPVIDGFVEPLSLGRYLVTIGLSNEAMVEEATFQDLALYDCRFQVRVQPSAKVEPRRLALAPDDDRYHDIAKVYAQGHGCVAEWTGSGIETTSLPVFLQPKAISRTDHVPPLEWKLLADGDTSVLTAVGAAMQLYLDAWASVLASAPPTSQLESGRERDAFDDEYRRYRLGLLAMQQDPRLALAFRLANQTMEKAGRSRGFATWRLFQLVFMVSHLPDLLAREGGSGSQVASELEFADVLWFPTGGGKTEAYLGLILTALFYDRLRGKRHGPTAWLKFPLRMLSVQQLLRVLRVLIVAETIRTSTTGCEGDPFALGYLVGGSNTPNALRWEQGWWPGFARAVPMYAENQQVFAEHRLISQCPVCGAKDGIDLVPEAATVRLLHRCGKCGAVIPLHSTDEEVYRFMPAVLVGTVDKLTGFAFFGEFTQFSHGPRWRCPQHGWFTYSCLADNCDVKKKDRESVSPPWYDPVPALIIQDELHLVREELGAFDAHYEGLLAELQAASPSHRPSKILAASATIEQYDAQIRQVYGRRARSFPAPGFQREQSFYTATTGDIQRIYLGVLPHYRRPADIAAIIQQTLVEFVAELQDDLTGSATTLGWDPADLDGLAALLFQYEVSLAYVNSKPDGDFIHEELDRLSEHLVSDNRDPITSSVLTGDVGVTELAGAIDRVEHGSLSQPRGQRLRAIVGTSVVSHGVDLERLNCLIMTGLPPTVADYIQATSRSGRVHVGIVVTVFDSRHKRDRGYFRNFATFHRFLDRMVEPVPINRYALLASHRTLPGVIMALLWDMTRDPDLHAPEEGIHYTRSLRSWWNARSPSLLPIIKERLEKAYRCITPSAAEASLEQELVAGVIERWEDVERHDMIRFSRDRSRDLFSHPVLTSFRDVETAVDFELRPWSQAAYEALFDFPPREGS